MSEREVTQEHVNKLVLIADRVRYMMPFDKDSTIDHCPFCNIGLDQGDGKHYANCTHLIAKRLMDELYPEEQEEGAEHKEKES